MKMLDFGVQMGIFTEFSKNHSTSNFSRFTIFLVWENLNILGPSTLRELSIAHSVGVVPPDASPRKVARKMSNFRKFQFW